MCHSVFYAWVISSICVFSVFFPKNEQESVRPRTPKFPMFQMQIFDLVFKRGRGYVISRTRLLVLRCLRDGRPRNEKVCVVNAVHPNPNAAPVHFPALLFSREVENL